MKHFKILGLLVTVSIGMMALVGNALATSTTVTTGGLAATPTIHMTNEGGHFIIANQIAQIECSTTLQATIQSHGGGVSASGNVSSLSFTGCTNSWHVTVAKQGSISFAHSSGHNGAVTSTGMRLEATRFGVTCVYDTNNTPMGFLTGGSTATLDVEGYIPLNTGLSSFLCTGGQPTKAQWAGSLVTTGALYIAP